MLTSVRDRRLTRPPLPPLHVRRGRLRAALDDGVTHPLTLVAAGPGYGKTVLLSDWAATWTGPCAWVSLDAQLNEPYAFLAALHDAFELAGLGHAPVTDREIALGAAECAEEATHSMIERGADPDHPLVLVLDDAHLLTHPAVRTVLHGLLRRWHDRMRLVLAARSDPLLPLHRYRLAGAVAELRAADLAVTRQEARQLLIAHGVHLADQHIDALIARTEGWLAGVRLCAMSMRGTDRAADVVTDLLLAKSNVGEYLIDEVLGRLPATTRRLLVDTSFLDEVNGELATAVTDIPDAEVILDRLSRSNSFVLPLDRAGSTFRYHQLMAEMLRYLLRRSGARRSRDLMCRAARWYAAEDDLVRAVDLARRADDWAFLANLVCHGGLVRMYTEPVEVGELPGQAILASADAAGGDLVEARIAAAAAFMTAGSTEAARDQLAGIPTHEQLGVELAVSVDVVTLVTARMQLDVRTADEAATRLVQWACRAQRPDVASAAQLDQAMVHFYAGSHSAVEATLRCAAADAERAHSPHLHLECVAQLAHVNAFWSRFHTASNDLQRAGVILRDHPRLTAPATLLLAVAERDIVRADFASAAKAIRRASQLPSRRGDSDVRDELELAGALLHLASGRYDDARDALERAAPAPRSFLSDYRVALGAWIDIARRRPADSVQTLTAAPLHRSSGVVCLARAAAHQALGELQPARAALRPVLTASGPPSIRPVLVGALVLEAALIEATHDPEGMVAQSLVRAVELADGDIVLPFVPASRLLADVIARHCELAARWPLPAAHPVQITASGDAALTDRERAVLRWLATDMSTREIAAELGLSVNTVKTHVAAIYRKLATPRRREAVLRARQLELL